MDRLKRAALITRLLEKLSEKGSWCGETHVQKAIFFLQNLVKVPLGFEFILYKHGPFSFDLRDELTSLRADGLIHLEAQWPYGPRIVPTDISRYIQQINSKTVERYEHCIAFVADKLGPKRVAELERIATALYLIQQQGADGSIDERANQLTKLKPHISFDLAKAAIEEVDQIIAEAQTCFRGWETLT